MNIGFDHLGLEKNTDEKTLILCNSYRLLAKACQDNTRNLAKGKLWLNLSIIRLLA